VTVLRVGARRSGGFPAAEPHTPHAAELPLLLPRTGAPLFHAVANVDLPPVRVRGIAYVLTVHDLIPLTSPDTVSRPFHWQFRLWLARSLQLADHVVCVSDWTRKTLLARFPALPSSRVSMVHNGVDHVRSTALDAVSEAWLRSLGLPERWVLFAGALDARKNVGLLLSALEHLGPAAPTLVLAGQPWFGSEVIERRVGTLRRRGVDIRPVGHLVEPLLWALIARAPLFVFPPATRGSGCPRKPWRSGRRWCEQRRLASRCRPAAAYVDSMTSPVARTLVRLLDARTRMREAVSAQAFTWDRGNPSARCLPAGHAARR
jgi:glycosyltransferase involved in cell wall biosynthesis